jgi:hypothetical protein
MSWSTASYPGGPWSPNDPLDGCRGDRAGRAPFIPGGPVSATGSIVICSVIDDKACITQALQM